MAGLIVLTMRGTGGGTEILCAEVVPCRVSTPTLESARSVALLSSVQANATTPIKEDLLKYMTGFPSKINTGIERFTRHDAPRGRADSCPILVGNCNGKRVGYAISKM